MAGTDASPRPKAKARSARVPAAQRRAEILDTAARLFWKWGYSGVGIDDIGAKIGISGPAIYRHFAGKEALLAEIGTGFLDAVAAAAEETTVDGIDCHTLARLIGATVELVIDRPAELAVCLRDLWHLGPVNLVPVGERWQRVVEPWAAAIAKVRPDLPPQDSSTYVRAACGLIIGASQRSGTVPRTRLVELTTEMISHLVPVRLDTPASIPESSKPIRGGWIRSSRREQILSTAIVMFRERGFRGVSMADIADSLGLTAGASYRHFENKEDILATAIERAGIRVFLAMNDALAQASSADDALDRMLRAYIGVCAENRELIAVSLTEAHHVPQVFKTREPRQRVIHEEWSLCLATTRPDLSAADAGVLINAIFALITESVRSRRVGRRPQLADDLHKLATAVLNGS